MENQEKTNIGRLFYKEYYKEVDFNYIFKDSSSKEENEKNEGIIKGKNEKIRNADLESIPNPVEDWKNNPPTKESAVQTIHATVLYPGLVTGTGLFHASKGLKGGFNLGMHFDYTTGMPVVYGSSVKGVLRDYFERSKKGGYEDDLLQEVAKKVDIADLFEDIFNGKERVKSEGASDESPREYRNKSLYQRDVFFDAVIVEAYKGRILEDDAITPHKDVLKNPIPIAMLKIAPGCRMEFRFLLHPFKAPDGTLFKVDEKKKLFADILGRMGVGAKTNVGYGQLEISQEGSDNPESDARSLS